MRRPILGTLFALACVSILLPVASSATPKVGAKENGFSIADEHYLRTYVQCWAEFKDQCGRNIVDDGTASGSPPSEAQVADSTATMDRWLHPPVVREPIAESSPAPVASTPTTTVAPASVGGTPPEYIAQCESGGDYGAVNSSSGAYGKWQILPSTSAAYGCDMSTPAGQDACAAEIWDGGAGAGQWVCG